MKLRWFSILLVLAAVAHGQNGILDSTFGSNGIAEVLGYDYPTLWSTSVWSTAHSVSDSKNRNIIGGSFELNNKGGIRVFRLKENGILDSSFGWIGKTDLFLSHTIRLGGLTSLPNNGIAVLAILNYTNSVNDIAIIELDSNGYLLRTAYLDYYQTESPQKLMHQSNHNYILSGSAAYRGFVARIDSNWQKDLSFGVSGLAAIPGVNGTLGAFDTELFNDGSIISAFNYSQSSYVSSLIKLLPNGLRDANFGVNGRIDFNGDYFNQISDVAIQDSNRIVLLGVTQIPNYTIKVIRLHSNGGVDGSFVDYFEPPGYTFTRRSITLQEDDKIILTYWGDTTGFRMTRLNQNGTVDSSFGINGTVSITMNNYAGNRCNVQPDGKIVLCGEREVPIGSRRMFASRYISGTPISVSENSLIHPKLVFFPNPFSYSASLRFTLLKETDLNIYVIDINGNIIGILKNAEHFLAGEHQIDINDYQSLGDGQYFVVISTSSNRVSIPIIKSD